MSERLFQALEREMWGYPENLKVPKETRVASYSRTRERFRLGGRRQRGRESKFDDVGSGYFEYALDGCSVSVFRLVDGPSEIQTLEVTCDAVGGLDPLWIAQVGVFDGEVFQGG